MARFCISKHSLDLQFIILCVQKLDVYIFILSFCADTAASIQESMLHFLCFFRLRKHRVAFGGQKPIIAERLWCHWGQQTI